jgi:predicted glycosyltransferase
LKIENDTSIFINPLKGYLKPRIAVYTHDTFGLGHVRRCLHIMRELSREMPHSAIMFITGSPALHYLKEIPKNVDIVKIPTVVKTGALDSLPPHIPIGLPELTEIRSRIIKEAVLSFNPEVFIVDNFPLGAHAELLPVLKAIRFTKTKTVLGLRDILDAGDVIRAEWDRNGVYDAIDRYYDKVLIYGVPEIFDAIKEYDIPPQIQKKVHYCGYLTATDAVPKLDVDIRKKYSVKGPLILATGGGGGDAFPLLYTLIEAVNSVPNSHTLIFTGPLMGDGDRTELEKTINGNPNITLREFVPDLRPYLKEADLLVSMCGYNIASEIVFHGTKAVIAPRTWRFGEHAKRKKTREEKEQILRGRVLAKFGLVNMLDPDDLNAKSLANIITHTLQNPLKSLTEHSFAVDGLRNAVEHIKEFVKY